MVITLDLRTSALPLEMLKRIKYEQILYFPNSRTVPKNKLFVEAFVLRNEIHNEKSIKQIRKIFCNFKP